MNILWICTDQQRLDTLGCYGNPYVNTPNIDRLAKEGVLFENAYAQSPVCAPSRGCFLTGRYPRTCGPRQNGQDIGKAEKLFPKMLQEQGYFCGLSGKLHLSACHDKQTGRYTEPRIDDGYEFFSWSHHPQPHRATNWPANAYNQFLIENGLDYVTPDREDCRFVQTGMPEEFHQTTWCTNEALKFMEIARTYEKPWLFSINYFDPHHPFDPPREYLERYLPIVDELPLPNFDPAELPLKPVFQQKDHEGAYDSKGYLAYDDMTAHDHRMIKAAYYAMVDLIDKQIGRLLDYLEKTGQRENTLILFHADHGENLGDHGMYLKGPYFYENNVHVPLIISMPGTLPEGIRKHALVELCDLAPTLCDAAAIPQYPGFQGKSFYELLCSETKDFHRTSVYSEYYNSNINHRNPFAFATMVCDGRYKLVRVHPGTDIRSEQQELFKNAASEAVLGDLYDLTEDPLERCNHYSDPAFAGIRLRLLETMTDRMAETCDPLPVRLAEW